MKGQKQSNSSEVIMDLELETLEEQSKETQRGINKILTRE